MSWTCGVRHWTVGLLLTSALLVGCGGSASESAAIDLDDIASRVRVNLQQQIRSAGSDIKVREMQCVEISDRQLKCIAETTARRMSVRVDVDRKHDRLAWEVVP